MFFSLKEAQKISWSNTRVDDSGYGEGKQEERGKSVPRPNQTESGLCPGGIDYGQ